MKLFNLEFYFLLLLVLTISCIPKKESHVVGLKQLGNTCYMNSVLQALIHTEKLSKFYLSDSLKIRDDAYDNGALTKAYQKLLKEYFAAEAGDSILPKEFKDVLQKNPLFQTEEFRNLCSQKDASDFLKQLFKAMEKEVGKDNANDLSLKYSSALKNKIKKDFNNPDYFFSIFNEVFSFSEKTTIKCYQDDNVVYTSPTLTIANQINLELNSNASEENTLEKILLSYFKESTLETYRCGDNDIEKDRVKKGSSFQSLPGIGKKGNFMINLKRFEADYSNWPEVIKNKITDPVSFPIELKLSSLEAEDKTVTFKLYALINHFGSLDGGHYTSVVRSKGTEKWYEANDSSITEKSLDEVLKNYKQSAYILFYERVSN